MALKGLWNDARFGLRGLRTNPGFAAMVILTLSLGIGASSWLFTMLRQWVLEGIALPAPGELQVVWTLDTKRGLTKLTSSADFIDWREQSSQVFQNLSAWSPQQINLTGVDLPETISGARVSSNFFRTLGAVPAFGRDFHMAEEQPGAEHVVILSYGFWKDRFNGDTVGKTIDLDGARYAIVGVMPESFQFIFLGHSSVFVPLVFTEKEKTDRTTAWLNVIGRKKPEGTAPAEQRMAVIAADLANRFPDSNANRGILLNSLPKEIGKHASAQAIYTGFVVGICILLICILNICGLFLSRALSRRNEISIRLALGMSRRRLVQQLLTENLMLMPVAVGLGLTLTTLGGNWITSMIPYETRGLLPNDGVLYIDFGTAVYAVVIGSLAVILFSLAPIMESRKLNLVDVLKDANYTSSISGSTGRLRQGLLVFEIVLALAILVPTGLASASLANRFKEDLGFNPDHLLTCQLNLPAVKYDSGASLIGFTDRLLGGLSALPGVQSAAIAQSIPFGRNGQEAEFAIEGEARPKAGEVSTAQVAGVSGGYDRTLQLKLVAGRFITESDTASSTPVTVISSTLAWRYFPHANALAHRLRIGSNPVPRIIVGIVDDVKVFRLSDPPAEQIYVPLSQIPSRSLWLVVRSNLDSRSLVPQLRSVVRVIDAQQPISQPLAMGERINEQESTSRIFAQFCISFGILALFLSAVGSYGVMSVLMDGRKREIAVRVACGATRPRILWTVLSSSIKLIGIGLPIGLAAAWGMAHLMRRLLFGVSSHDVVIYGRATFSLVAAVMLACLVPLVRTIAVNPAETLRSG